MTAWRFLFISLIIHTLFWVGMKQYANLQKQSEEKKQTAVQFEVFDSKSQQMAHSTKSNQLKLDSLKPRFYGENDQRVLKETKAKNLGYIQAEKKIKGQKSDNNNQNEEKEKIKDLAKDQTNDPSSPSKKSLTSLGQSLFNEAASDTSDFHDVNEGAITSLNTERFIYYSFFQRIDQRISSLWSNNLRNYQARWSNEDANKLGGQSWLTQIEVVLDKEGHYLRTIIYRSSGVDPIDQAPIEAFATAALFPNPPKGMIKPDGTVRLRYSFRFDVASPRLLARP